MRAGLQTFDWFRNLVFFVVLKLGWFLFETATYILKTGFVGYSLGSIETAGINDAADTSISATTDVEPIFECMKKIFSALIQGIPDVIKPLIHISIFAKSLRIVARKDPSVQ